MIRKLCVILQKYEKLVGAKKRRKKVEKTKRIRINKKSSFFNEIQCKNREKIIIIITDERGSKRKNEYIERKYKKSQLIQVNQDFISGPRIRFCITR